MRELLKRPAVWIGLAAVVLFVVLSRRKRATAAGPGGEEQPAAALAAGGLAAQQTEQGSAIDRALEALQLKQIGGEQQLEAYQQQRAAAGQALYGQLYKALSGGGGRIPAGVKCPSGKPRIDPSTGEIYCRERTGRGFFQGITFRDILGASRDVLGASRTYGTTRGPRK